MKCKDTAMISFVTAFAFLRVPPNIGSELFKPNILLLNDSVSFKVSSIVYLAIFKPASETPTFLYF